ncbi:hypothetical protein OAB63_02040 [Alphaproteobacteria bacterium]|nr:hypothetical protein [Alphaproteobacteria bacterium]
MQYFFFGSRVADLDHTVPVIYSLLEAGISSNNIKYMEIFPRLELKSIENDFRLKIINDKNVFFNQNIIGKKYLNIELFFNNTSLNNNFITRIIIKSIKYFMNLLVKLFYKIRLFVIIYFTNEATIIVDHSNKYFYKYLIFLALKKKFKIIGLPHGMVLHNGYIDNKIHKIMYEKTSPLNTFVQLVFCNKHDLFLASQNNQSLLKTKILGSIRFSKEWTQVLKINLPIQKKKNNSKIKILIFEEKTGENINNKFIPWVNLVELTKVLDHLKKLDNCELTICNHPSKYKKDFKDANIKYLNSTETTFQAVLKSDIVIGCVTSSLLDPLVLNKRILSLSHCHYFKSLIDVIEPNMVTNSYEDFKNKLKELIDHIDNGHIHKFQDNLYKEFINNSNQNIFRLYSNLIIK